MTSYGTHRQIKEACLFHVRNYWTLSIFYNQNAEKSSPIQAIIVAIPRPTKRGKINLLATADESSSGSSTPSNLDTACAWGKAQMLDWGRPWKVGVTQVASPLGQLAVQIVPLDQLQSDAKHAWHWLMVPQPTLVPALASAKSQMAALSDDRPPQLGPRQLVPLPAHVCTHVVPLSQWHLLEAMQLLQLVYSGQVIWSAGFWASGRAQIAALS